MKSIFDKHFLWPRLNKKRLIRSLIFPKKVTVVEEQLHKLFPSGYPVLCSSARASIAIALSALNVTRSDYVGLFPFASHCVLDAVSRIGTPIPINSSEGEKVTIIYHQWGYNFSILKCEKFLIEDSVDTLCVPGAQLFPNNGSYEIWSLPKILGTSSGGVLWCKDENMANIAKRIRDARGGGFCLWALRMFGKIFYNLHLCWTGIEANFGNLSKLQSGEIFIALESWNVLVADRKEKLSIALKKIKTPIKITPDRLPVVIPIYTCDVKTSLNKDFFLEKVREMQISSDGNRISTRPIIPIPIHQDVTPNELELMVKLIV